MKSQELDSEQTQKRERINACIASAVLGALGRPDDLRAVSVRRLWGDNYRVNVLTGMDITSALIAHSYFLTADASGDILEASPPIAKLY